MLFKIYSGEIVSCSGIMARIILCLSLVIVRCFCAFHSCGFQDKPVNVEIIQIVRRYIIILGFYAVQILHLNDHIVNTILRCQCPQF